MNDFDMDSPVPQHKFTTVVEEGVFKPHSYSNTYAVDKTRLCIAPSSDHIGLLIKLSRVMASPFRVRYVLQVPSEMFPAGRYDLTNDFSLADLESFLKRFSTFFEEDGRHHIWIRSSDAVSALVYDQHNIIYAYGSLDAFERVCTNEGMTEGSVDVPFPHAHAFQEKYDQELAVLLSEWSWERTDLVEDVDFV
ncbi:MAG: hypothetical protein KIT74_09775 [Fimbriimonadales bacterium]|nr:hypothetical protein [Fimbriimonadales bacterium]